MKKEVETINEVQKEMKKTISELKNTVEGIRSRLDETEDQIRKLEKKVEENTQNEQEKEKRLWNKEVFREIQDNVTCNNIHITGIPEGEENQETEKLFEKVMMENLPKLMRENVTQIQESQSPNQEEPKEAH